MHVVIDAMNVLGSRPDGWWRDREGALRRLADEVATWAEGVDADVLLVADGHPVDGLLPGPHGAVEVRYATRGGPDAADDDIVVLVEQLIANGDGGAVVEVVTADRDLRQRVTAYGAEVTGPRRLLDRLG